MRATIKDLARIANLSTSTVSRVLTGDPHVSLDAVEKVNEAIKATGYIPNSAARSLVKQRRNLIGLIVPELENPYYTLIVRGVEAAVSEFGYGVVLISGSNQSANSNVIESLLEVGVDGIIHAGLLQDDQSIPILSRWGIPYVLVGRQPVNEKSNYVVFDDYGSAYKATRHLLSLGHRKIAFLFGKLSSISSELKLRGYKDALTEQGLPFDKDLFAVGDLDFECSRRAVHKLLEKGTDMTAILASNDMMAFGARDAVLKAGLDIPGDISLVGIDNIFWSGMWGINLTTVDVPKFEMGQLAGQILIRHIDDPKLDYEHYTLPSTVVLRESCRNLLKEK